MAEIISGWAAGVPGCLAVLFGDKGDGVAWAQRIVDFDDWGRH